MKKPAPMHTPVDLADGWQVTVTDVIPNATDLVLATNSRNDPPEEGYQFFIATVEATNRRSEEMSLHASLRFRAYAEWSETYTTFGNGCGVIPDEFPDISEGAVPPRGTISGNICWQVRTEDAGSLVMYDDPDRYEIPDMEGPIRRYMSLVP